MTNPKPINALFQSIVAGATTVTTTFDALNNGLNMANRAVTKASEEQMFRHRYERATFLSNLVRTASEEQSQADLKALEYRAQSTQHAELYDANLARFRRLFPELDTNTQA